MSIKKSTSWESEVKRKSKKLDNLRIDASSYDSVKHVKGEKKLFFQENAALGYCRHLMQSGQQHLELEIYKAS